MLRSQSRRIAAAILVAALSAACTEVRETSPKRTATEQLLLSTAADRAIDGLSVNLPAGTRVYVDESRFDAYDKGYAIGAIRDRLLAGGANLVNSRGEADAIVEIRSGALSINQSDSLVGLPSYKVPIPLAGDLETPELALLKQTRRRGIAKIAITAYWTKTGALADRTGPIIGVSGFDDWKLLGIGWHHGDEIPSRLPPDDDADTRAPGKDGSAGADP